MDKIVIGLTGLIGSGKTLVSNEFAKKGIEIIDTDVIAHNFTTTESCATLEIKSVFGAEFLNSDMSLNRSKMRELIFHDLKAKKKLENILHPLIFKEALSQISKASSSYIIVVVPLLFQSLPFMSIINRILLVNAKQGDIIARVMNRSNLSEEMVLKIIQQQTPEELQLLLSDDIIENDSCKDSVIRRINDLHLDYVKLSSNKVNKVI